MTEYDAVIFDNDGVIVEPTDREVLVGAVVDAFAAFDVAVDRAATTQSVAQDTVPTELIDRHDLDPEAFWHQRELTASLAQQAHTREGGKAVYEDVSALDVLEVPLGLVSNNQHATVEFLCSYHEFDYFETVYGRQPTLTGAARRKPAPYYLEQALADVAASDALYVGDSEKDIVAAQRAGIDSVFLRRGHVADVTLSVEPTAVMPDLQTLVEALTEPTELGGISLPDARH